jgi:MtN3 and saliva related transmembrane protein
MDYELIGYAAGICTASSLIPQVYKSWKTKSTRDISFLWNLILMIGLTLWVIYGYSKESLPILIFAGLEMLMTFSMLILKIKYK